MFFLFNDTQLIIYLVLSGVFLGFTMGSKETGFITPLIGFSVYLLYGSTSVDLFYYFLIWCIVGFFTLYLIWPLLWRNPLILYDCLTAVADAPSGATIFYRGITKPQVDFYITTFLVMTHSYLIVTYIFGIIKSFLPSNYFNFNFFNKSGKYSSN